MTKAQADIVSITLIVILSITLVGTGYLWLRPLIEKRQDTFKVEKLLKDFDPNNPDSLPRKIEDVAKTQSEMSFTISSDGTWILSPADTGENYIEFSTFSKVSNVAIGEGWISYTPGGNCAAPSLGKVGESSFIVCIKAEAQADGYVLTYRAIFRGVEETPAKIYKINLKRGDGAMSREREIILKFGETKLIGNQMIASVLILF